MSEIRANLIADAVGTGPAGLFKQSAAKAWANLNGTGTIALRASFNVSSVVDNGTGDYSFNYTNALNSANYSRSGFARSDVSAFDFVSPSASSSHIITTSSVRMGVVSLNTSAAHDTGYDVVEVCTVIHGDLA
jgi:hypothetical protein